MNEPAVASIAAERTPEAPRAAAMRFIMLAVLIDMVAIGLIVPVLPGLVGTFTNSPTEQTWWFGAVTLAFGVANFFGSPILGALSDRYGRRPVLLIGFSGLALSFFVTGLATALWMLIVVRLFSGAMQSNASVANAYVADITPAADRARRFGLLGAMFGMGFVIGPALGGLLGQYDVRSAGPSSGSAPTPSRRSLGCCDCRAQASSRWWSVCRHWRSSRCTPSGCSTPGSSSAGARRKWAPRCLSSG
jgi:DHA1 family tetracycline resistance protein-like MFS transporter